MCSELVKPHHLRRRAVIYVRQSTPNQVLTNQESLRLQYALQYRAREFGWHEADINVIDSDLGMSGAAVDHRQGFKDLVARVTLGEIGIIPSIAVTRLARNCSDWYPLLDVCGHRQCLIADRDGVYDPGTPSGRLLLGLKGTISELELHTIRSRLTAGLLAKAEHGELALTLPVGLVRDASGVVTKAPDLEVSGRIRRRVICIERDPETGRYLFPDTDNTMRALRQLRAGAIARIDLTQNYREQEGHQDRLTGSIGGCRDEPGGRSWPDEQCAGEPPQAGDLRFNQSGSVRHRLTV